MRGERLIKAIRIAERVFKKYEGFNPRNLKQNGRHHYIRWTDDEIKRIVGTYRKTKVPCSCHTCGNPRRYYGYLTMHEARQHLEADFQYDEIGWNHRKVRWLKGWLD